MTAATISTPRFDSLVHVTRGGTWINNRDDASLTRLDAALADASVSHACLVGLSGVVDNDYILECASQSSGRLIPIAGVDPSDTQPADIAALGPRGFRGIKLHPRLHGYDPLDPRALALMCAARDARLVVFLDTLFRQRARATRASADIVDELAHRCDGARLVLLHGGGAELLRMAEVVRVNPSLLLDVSYTLLAYKHSSVAQDIRWVFERLDQRVVVGSDMPEFTPGEAFAEAERLADGLPASKWANIAHGNLSRLFPV